MVLTYSSSPQEVRQSITSFRPQWAHNEFKGSLNNIAKLYLKKPMLDYHAQVQFPAL